MYESFLLELLLVHLKWMTTDLLQNTETHAHRIAANWLCTIQWKHLQFYSAKQKKTKTKKKKNWLQLTETCQHYCSFVRAGWHFHIKRRRRNKKKSKHLKLFFLWLWFHFSPKWLARVAGANGSQSVSGLQLAYPAEKKKITTFGPDLSAMDRRAGCKSVQVLFLSSSPDECALEIWFSMSQVLEQVWFDERQDF